MPNKILPRILFILSALLLLAGFNSKDPFYYALSIISLFVAYLTVNPSILGKRKAKLPSLPNIGSLPNLSFKISPQGWFKNLKKIKQSKKDEFTYKNLPALSRTVYGFIFMVFLFTFTLISILKIPSVNGQNLLAGYYLSQLSYLRGVLPYIAVGIIGAIFIAKNRDHKVTSFQLISRALIITFLAFNLALPLTYLLGIVHVNLDGFRISNSASSSDVAWGKDSILAKLQENKKLPKILGVDKGIKKTIINAYISQADRRFYTSDVLQNIPDSLYLLFKNRNESLVMAGDTLIVTNLNKNEIEAISPKIGKLFVEKYLEPSYIKDEPKIGVLGRQEYLKYRDEQINKRLDEIDGVIAWAQRQINIIWGNIQNAKSKIQQNKDGLASAISEKDSDDRSCRTACYYSYYFNQCYRYYTDSYCDSVKAGWDKTIAQYQKNISDWEVYLSQQQSSLPEYTEYKDYFEDIRVLVESQKDIVPYELGVFEPDNSIKVALDSTSTKSVTDYFSTLIHEYLHYTSYVSDERDLPLFFEEGLTEYFTRKILENEFSESSTSGYSHIVEVIEEMMKKIPEEEFKRIYFTKNENLLISLLNKEYGSQFYRDSQYYFDAMTFVSSNQGLKFANNIMTRIGGKELIYDDVFK